MPLCRTVKSGDNLEITHKETGDVLQVSFLKLTSNSYRIIFNGKDFNIHQSKKEIECQKEITPKNP